MQLHELKKEKDIRKKKKRIGRGGKRGTYSGRGQKGQKARAGAKIRPALRDSVISIPKLRGFKNKPKSKKPSAVSLSVIDKIKERVITNQFLIKNKIIKRGETAKILGNGSIKSSKEIVGIKVSKKAKEKIEKAGGIIK